LYLDIDEFALGTLELLKLCLVSANELAEVLVLLLLELSNHVSIQVALANDTLDTAAKKITW